MNFQTLKTLQTIAECQKLTAAAQKLNTSQPSLSRTIRQAEKELGFSLFRHEKNQISLNKNGEKYLAAVTKFLNQYESCVQEIREDNGIYSPNLTIAYSAAGSSLPQLIYEFKQQYPHANFTLKSYHRGIMDYETQFCFFCTQAKMPESAALCLAEEELFLTTSPESPLAELSSIALQDLASQTFLFADTENDMHAIQAYYCKMAGFIPLASNIIEKQNTLTMLLELGMGVSLLPRLVTSRLKQIPIRDVRCTRFIYMQKNQNIFETKLARQFEKFCTRFYSS